MNPNDLQTPASDAAPDDKDKLLPAQQAPAEAGVKPVEAAVPQALAEIQDESDRHDEDRDDEDRDDEDRDDDRDEDEDDEDEHHGSGSREPVASGPAPQPIRFEDVVSGRFDADEQ